MRIDFSKNGIKYIGLTYSGKMIFDYDKPYVLDDTIHKIYIRLVRYEENSIKIPILYPQYFLFDNINFNSKVDVLYHKHSIEEFEGMKNTNFTIYFSDKKDYIKLEKYMLKLKLS